jgi:hypothetical protein
MPRISAEARSAAAWLEGPEPPRPQRGMTAAARRIWREVVECRAPDFFSPGSLNLLRTFCEVSVALQELGPQLLADVHDDKVLERVRKLGTLQAVLAQKLRISIQNATRSDRGKVTEKPVSIPDEPRLLGGEAIKWQRERRERRSSTN